MEDNKVITVNGFAFENPTTGSEALKEQEAIEYVNKQLNFDDTKSLLALYNQMVTRRMFHTEVGFSYLKSIQDYLMKSDVDPAVIESIPIASSEAEIDSNSYNNDSSESKEEQSKEKRTNNRHNDDIKTKNRERKLISKNKRLMKLSVSFIVISIVLVITIGAMFVIANTSNNPTILNYEEVLQNKYASWEQDLQKREADLEKKEKLLKIK
ncbi:MAG: hypothetical protein E7279_00210 [Lachnospiraceae bacterium]|nr:hypothetical protein [Lachnospiraceae bacterium]